MLKIKLDFVYLTPAILCNLALLCGIIPAVFCLDGALFAYVSVALFLLSLLIHLYIVLQWRRYQTASPVGYAIAQPILHMITLVFALAVGATSLCTPTKPEAGSFIPEGVEMMSPAESISDHLSDE